MGTRVYYFGICPRRKSQIEVGYEVGERKPGRPRWSTGMIVHGWDAAGVWDGDKGGGGCTLRRGSLTARHRL
ncbi:DUF402 domain-containing protein [Sesbania bispinosa]|nr:DUF402 domain-containing protein [Sesbania bispinosa]